MPDHAVSLPELGVRGCAQKVGFEKAPPHARARARALEEKVTRLWGFNRAHRNLFDVANGGTWVWVLNLTTQPLFPHHNARRSVFPSRVVVWKEGLGC